ncbi:hypothetical protein FDZ71_00105 [bacterium]|nr:MAG: hypothetical protein FDZ71_00105 [bacterium]
MASEWKQSADHTEDPEVVATRDESFTFDLTAEPNKDRLPDFKFSYALGKDAKETSYESTFEYKLLNDMATVSVEAKKDTSNPKNPEEDTTDDRSLGASFKVSREVTKKLKLEGELNHTREQGLTLDSDYRLIDKTDTLSNEAKAKATIKPMEWWELVVSQENTWDRDFMVSGPAEHGKKWESSSSMKPKLTEVIETTLDYKSTTEITEGTDADTVTYTQEASAQVSFKPMKIVEIIGSYDWSKEDGRPELESHTNKRTDEYKLEGKWNLWEEQIKLAGARNFSYEWEHNKNTTNSFDWEFSLEVTPKKIPKLEVTPKYSLSDDNTTRESALEIGIKHVIELGKVTKFTTEHKYARTHTLPVGEVDYISRDDETKFSLEMKDFLKNMTFNADYERKVSDESEDDQYPEASYSLKFKYGWKALNIYELTLEHSYERSNTSEDKKSYDASLAFPIHKDHFKFKIEYGFETQIEGEKSDSESYAVEISGKF